MQRAGGGGGGGREEGDIKLNQAREKMRELMMFFESRIDFIGSIG